jgi:hypothetical protein
MTRPTTTVGYRAAGRTGSRHQQRVTGVGGDVRAELLDHAGLYSDEEIAMSTSVHGIDAQQDLTPEQASRMAVTAVTSDLEFWARTVSVDGRVGLNDLTRTLDMIRVASLPEDPPVDAGGRETRVMPAYDPDQPDLSSWRQ